MDRVSDLLLSLSDRKLSREDRFFRVSVSIAGIGSGSRITKSSPHSSPKRPTARPPQRQAPPKSPPRKYRNFPIFAQIALPIGASLRNSPWGGKGDTWAKVYDRPFAALALETKAPRRWQENFFELGA